MGGHNKMKRVVVLWLNCGAYVNVGSEISQKRVPVACYYYIS